MSEDVTSQKLALSFFTLATLWGYCILLWVDCSQSSCFPRLIPMWNRDCVGPCCLELFSSPLKLQLLPQVPAAPKIPHIPTQRSTLSFLFLCPSLRQPPWHLSLGLWGSLFTLMLALIPRPPPPTSHTATSVPWLACGGDLADFLLKPFHGPFPCPQTRQSHIAQWIGKKQTVSSYSIHPHSQ